MSGGMFSWKLVSGLFQAMFAIGSSGTILPIGHKMKEFGFTHPLIQDLSEVVLSACASVLEMYAALHAKRCRYKDVRIVEYLVHNACFHYVRLAGLLKALSHSKVDKHRKRKPIKVNDATMCIWGVGGNKFHYLQRHMSIVKREMGANMDSTDTQQSEKGHITFVKTSYQVSCILRRELDAFPSSFIFPLKASSKRSSTRQTEMCDRNVTMRMICQMQLDSPAEGLIQPEDSKTGDIKTQTVSSASSTPFTRLRMIKKSHTSFYCWTNESGKSSRSYLHPLVNSHIVSEAISDITEEYSSGNIHELRVYLMESVIIEGLYLITCLLCQPNVAKYTMKIVLKILSIFLFVCLVLFGKVFTFT